VFASTLPMICTLPKLAEILPRYDAHRKGSLSSGPRAVSQAAEDAGRRLDQLDKRDARPFVLLPVEVNCFRPMSGAGAVS
jgi:hypothetical protein